MWANPRFSTVGLEEATDESLQGRMRALTERAVDMADICLFLIDSRAGVTSTDQLFADLLRKRGTKVILGANKSEGKAGEAGFYDAYSLGLGEPIALSAEHGEGMDELAHVLRAFEDTLEAREEAVTDLIVDEDGEAEELPSGTVTKPMLGQCELVRHAYADF